MKIGSSDGPMFVAQTHTPVWAVPGPAGFSMVVLEKDMRFKAAVGTPWGQFFLDQGLHDSVYPARLRSAEMLAGMLSEMADGVRAQGAAFMPSDDTGKISPIAGIDNRIVIPGVH